MIIDPKEHRFQDIYKLMIGSIVPRPIAFVSTISKDGTRNLAPFSFFNGICSNPPTIMFAPARRSYSGETKDTLNNIRNTEEFVVNIVSEGFAEQMVACSTDFDPEVDEFDVSGLTPVPSKIVAPPRVEESRVNFECRLNQIVDIGDGSAGSGFVVIGTVVLFHVDDSIYENGRINLEKFKPIGRLAGSSYSRITDTFEIVRKIRPD
ncbi:MAG: flavin reductase family protein [Candidatus Marinimicrobia bacterium]|jgi:flavin reductase (DIM6/NTAB) family NADH-FMN oxidoreductase RutF|nr:flavin reductase family protein [Candidatus Neomarinimicrobiota bacterium]MDP6568270.1 flavin reductase family protein [Candidatus Neomarinimicrobiota bacterium]MDP7026193.1 flavin reductase family protein [Candidatus Neomarinimicrobiota bacterium]|tara:strand:- start:2627 stop:3247 length:621 start_codon:yes stop_codon:yes gene_type:complete